MFTHKPVILFTTANLAEIFKVASPEVANEIVTLLHTEKAVLNQWHSSLDMELLSKDPLKFLDELKAAFAKLKDNSSLKNANLCSEVALPPTSGQNFRCSLTPLPDEEGEIPRKPRKRKPRKRKSSSKFIDHSTITVDEEENLSRFIPRDENGKRCPFKPSVWDVKSAVALLKEVAYTPTLPNGKLDYDKIAIETNKRLNRPYNPISIRAVRSFLSTVGADGKRKDRKSTWSTNEDHALLEFYSSNGTSEDMCKLRNTVDRSDAAIATRIRIVDLLLNVVVFGGLNINSESPRLLSLVNSLYTAKILPSLVVYKPLSKDDLYSFWKQ